MANTLPVAGNGLLDRRAFLRGTRYPMRLLLPGWEGNMNVKWLRRLELTAVPAMTYYESRTYAPILPDGKAYQSISSRR